MPSARFENKDSTAYNVEGKVSGSSQKMSIPKGTTTVSWNGAGGDFIVSSGGVSFPDGKVVNNAHYTISGGKATKK